ncbi:MAG TPA: VTT domain-containing protein [Opitutaceae bacterium]|nr:VTT domain-containing protein [Opitutaceae bacterium]
MSKSSHRHSAHAGRREPRHKIRRLVLIGFAVAAVGIAAIPMLSGFDWAALQQRIEGLNPFLLFGLMATLPVAGFSIGIVYLIAGAKFGPLLGGVVVAGATAVHLLLTHWICRSFLRQPLERMIAKRKHHLPDIPPSEHGAISVMAALIPGPPYFIRNYLLALSGVPFRVYFWICLSIYVARSYVAIFLGDLSGDPNRRGFFVLVAVYIVKLGICAFLIARMRKRYKLRQTKQGGTKPPDGGEKSRGSKTSRGLVRSA